MKPRNWWAGFDDEVEVAVIGPVAVRPKLYVDACDPVVESKERTACQGHGTDCVSIALESLSEVHAPERRNRQSLPWRNFSQW